MQQTKLGISVGLLAALAFFTALFAGVNVALFLLVGYILMVEENPWLRRSAVKAVVIVFIFAVVSAIWNLIPEIFEYIGKIAYLFDGSLEGDFFDFLYYKLDSFVEGTLYLAEKILLLILGIKALSQKTLIIPAIEKIINKHIN